MRINFIYFIALSFIVVASSSCSKSNSGGSSSSKVIKYKEEVFTGSGTSSDSFNISYDAQGRLVSMVSMVNSGNKFLYGYPATNKVTFDIYNNNSVSIHEDIYLNASSNPDSTFQYNNTGDSSTEKYYYNAANQLTTVNNYDYTLPAGSTFRRATTYQYDSQGNIIKKIGNNGTQTYTYDLSLPAYTINLSPFPARIFHCYKTTQLTSGGTVYNYSYTYTFDSQGRVTKETAVSSINNVTATKTYTYQ